MKRYGYAIRPFGISCQPPGFIPGSYDPTFRIPNRVRHGSIAYPEPLSEEDSNHFDLLPLTDAGEVDDQPEYKVISESFGTLYEGESGREAREAFDQCTAAGYQADVYHKGVLRWRSGQFGAIIC